MSFSEIGQALYGRQWRRAMAEALRVSHRTVCRWESGEVEPSFDLAPQLRALIRERRAELGKLAKALDSDALKR